MTKIRIETDFKTYKIGLIKASQKVKAGSVEGMKRAIKELMNLSLNSIPRVPRDTGALAGSHSCFVNEELVEVSKESAPKATPLLTYPGKVGPKGVIEGVLVVHKPYAASLHEGISRHGTSYTFQGAGRGKKWIQAKVTRFKTHLFGLVAQSLRGMK